MKYLKKYSELILEVGESNLKPYEITDVVDREMPMGAMGRNFLFETESGYKYSINIATNLREVFFNPEDVENCDVIDESPEDFYDKLISISYFVYTNDIYYSYDDTIITNKGELYRIMATLVKVISEYLKQNPNIKYIFIGGQDGEKPESKKQRDNLYLNYFRKLKPNWQVGQLYVDVRNEWYYILKITD